jgi:glycosyltransferase involved in cell wall biosynthesis
MFNLKCRSKDSGRAMARRGALAMRVVINAQLDPATSGGIAQALLGLAYGLSESAHPDVELVYVCSPHSADAIRVHCGANARIEVNRGAKLPAAPGVRESNGFFESFGPDVVLFPYQSFTRLPMPTVFNPHDLQHRHLPEFFAPGELARRESLFGDAFRLASATVVGTQWVKDDILREYGLPADKVMVTSIGSPTEGVAAASASEVDSVLARRRLEPGFALYPAQTWPHKNHLRLIDALHLAASKYGCQIPLVGTGHQTEHLAAIQGRIETLGLQRQVRFLGRVSSDELAALYRAARCVLFPSLFEGGGFPVLEGFSASIPVACSAVTALPEVAGDAALLFDPLNVDSIAEAATKVYQDEETRRTLVDRGRHRIAQFSWRKTAQVYLDLFRQLALERRAVVEEDKRRWAASAVS